MDFDDILQEYGEFGTYQKMIVYLVLLPAVIPCGFHAYNQIFISAKPEHWCRIPELENQNLTVHFIKNYSIPYKTVGKVKMYEECYYYNKDFSAVTATDVFQNETEVPCKEGWMYDTSKYSSTIVTEWDLVCKKDFYPTLALIIFGLGGCIGNYVFGYVQDSYGRKKAYFFYLFIETFFGVASAFANNFFLWVLFRFGVGFTVPAILGSPFVLAVELVGPKNRAYCTILINIAYSMGLVLLSAVFYLVREWRQLTLVTTLPFLLLFLYWWVMPESPRWLYAKGDFYNCLRILNQMANINGVKVEHGLANEFEQEKWSADKIVSQNQRERHYGVLDLFRYPNLRKKTVLITLIWFTNTSVYVGLSYYAPALGNDEFLNFFLAGLVELPTYLFLGLAIEKFGRRWTLCSSMIIGGMACLATFLTENEESITLVLFCLGKMGISTSFVVLPLMASELYPTVVRGIGISFSSVVGQIGPIFIPLINYLGEEWMILPLMIMGGLLVFGGGLSLILPETSAQHLPQTLEEAENFGKTGKSTCISKRKNSSRRNCFTCTKTKKYFKDSYSKKASTVEFKEIQTE